MQSMQATGHFGPLFGIVIGGDLPSRERDAVHRRPQRLRPVRASRCSRGRWPSASAAPTCGSSRRPKRSPTCSSSTSTSSTTCSAAWPRPTARTGSSPSTDRRCRLPATPTANVLEQVRHRDPAAARRLRRSARRRAAARPQQARRPAVPADRRARHHARLERGAAAAAGPAARLSLHVPGRHRRPAPRARRAAAEAAGGRRRDGGRHRPRDSQSARVDVRIDADPAAGAAAVERPGAADGHRAARVGSAERHDPIVSGLRAAAACFECSTLDLRRVVNDTATLLRNSPELGDEPHHRHRACRARRSSSRPTRTRFGRSSGTSRPTACARCPNGGRLTLSAARRRRRGRRRRADCRPTRASAFPPRSSTASFSRSAGRSARAAALAWRSFTASSPTTARKIDVQSQVGRGTTFRVHFQPADGDATANCARPPSRATAVAFRLRRPSRRAS